MWKIFVLELHGDPYTFADDVAEHFAAEDENNDKSAKEILLAAVDGLTDDKLTYKLKVAERVKAKCERHPRSNPERDGRGGIKGGCSTCFSLYDLHQARLSLDAAHREFLRRAVPWTRIRLPRVESCSAEPHEPPLQGTSL
ncbi:MAG: hypothetical protein QOF72_901 [Blastocatellia bacterium]|jgi:hypothetical protein|nr:hypothetical protein [Blastocatellia bacterium]